MLGNGSFWLVSDEWHLPRALWIAGDLKLSAIPYGVRARLNRLRGTQIIGREAISVVHRWIVRQNGLL